MTKDEITLERPLADLSECKSLVIVIRYRSSGVDTDFSSISTKTHAQHQDSKSLLSAAVKMSSYEEVAKLDAEE